MNSHHILKGTLKQNLRLVKRRYCQTSYLTTGIHDELLALANS